METMEIKKAIENYNNAKIELANALKSVVESKGGEIVLSEPQYCHDGCVDCQCTRLYISDNHLYADYSDDWRIDKMLLPYDLLNSNHIRNLLTTLI